MFTRRDAIKAGLACTALGSHLPAAFAAGSFQMKAYLADLDEILRIDSKTGYAEGVNRVGQDPACEYNGGTCFIDAYGHTLQACPNGKESFITCTLEMEKLNAFRQKFPVLGDRDQSV